VASTEPSCSANGLEPRVLVDSMLKAIPRTLFSFDVNPVKKGILGPKQFIDLFGHLKVAELLGRNHYGPEFESDVRDGRYDVSSKYDIRTEHPEGVICKAGSGHDLTMWKVKTTAYKDELKRRYGGDWEKMWE
jgi:hypothetical protein